MKKRRYIILGIITLLVISIIFIIFIKIGNKNTNKSENIVENNTENPSSSDVEILETNTVENTINNIEEIEDIKNEINSTANTDIYQIEEEKDGRKILQIKPEVKFFVDLAGILKNDKPAENELNQLIENMPTKTGIWISKQSREEFLQLLKKNNIENFIINDEGYLQIDKNTENSIAKKLENMINSSKLYIINMTGIAYERDYISGEIVEYPFEDMDPYQIIEAYEEENKIILEVTSNKKQKLTDKEILDTIIKY